MVQYILCITENRSPTKLEISKFDKKIVNSGFFCPLRQLPFVKYLRNLEGEDRFSDILSQFKYGTNSFLIEINTMSKSILICMK